MGKIRSPVPVKLVVGLISGKDTQFLKAQIALTKNFGSIDFKSQIMPFTYTAYYEKELGYNLKRIFLSFNKLIGLEKIYKIKIYTNRLEEVLSVQGRRQINIDPGYLDASKLVLLSTKDYSHRIYLRNGIYAEATLVFKNKTFGPWPWTYPDYKTDTYINIFNSIRQIYLKQRKM